MRKKAHAEARPFFLAALKLHFDFVVYVAERLVPVC